MKKIMAVLVSLTLTITLAGCTSEEVTCGEGLKLVDGVCTVEETTETPTTTNPVVSQVCSNETGMHSVKGGKPTTISEWLNWNFIGGHLVTNPDNAWIIDYGAASFNVHTVAANAWEGSFTQSGMFLQEGCEYTFEFTLRTEAPNVKPDVIVFGETTSGDSFFEETVELNTNSTTYRFTVVPESSDWVSTGVYFANSRGLVLIEEIQIQRNEIGTYSDVQ